jgi:hypothetical protein
MTALPICPFTSKPVIDNLTTGYGKSFLTHDEKANAMQMHIIKDKSLFLPLLFMITYL